MPSLFESKFSPKKAPPRKHASMSNLNLDATERREEFGVDFNAVKMTLGNGMEVKLDLEEGQWTAESGLGGGSQKELIQLKKQYQKVSEENNLLKFKVEILLDMLAEKTAESHLQENQLDQAKKQMKKR